MKRSIVPIALACAVFAGATASAQTTIEVNGVPTSGVNGDVIVVENGSVMFITISNADHADSRYGLFGALDDNGNLGGWWLADDGGGNDPFPVLTGIPTAAIEAQLLGDGLTVDLVPDRAGSPWLVLDGDGDVTLRLRIPPGFVGNVNLQAATLEPGTLTSEFSDGVTLQIQNPSQAGKLLVARDVVAGNANRMEFGVLEFTGALNTGLYTPDATYTDVDVEAVVLSATQQFVNSTEGSSAMADGIGAIDATRPSLKADNRFFRRVELPAVGSVPARSLMRAQDNGTGASFFLVMNKETNPNAAGEYFEIDSSRQTHNDGTTNAWRSFLAFNADGTRMFAVLRVDDGTGNVDRTYLFATDGTTPFGGSASVDITPADTDGTMTVPERRAAFIEDFVVFVVNDSSQDINDDADTYSHRVYACPINVSAPTSTEVSMPSTGNGTTIDFVPDRGLIASEDESLLVLVAGDNEITTPAEGVSDSDWYRIENSDPSVASNFTQLGAVAEDSSFPVLFAPGAAYNGQSGYASLLSDGSRLGFVAYHHDENGSTLEDEDEVYFIATDGSETTGALKSQITTNDRIDSENDQTFLRAQDLFAASDEQLLFFYGADDADHDGNRTMDLYDFARTAATLTNVTETSGESSEPFTAPGDVFPEGYFSSPNGRYFYFARGDAADATATALVGYDLDSQIVFDVTGSEFGGFGSDGSSNGGDFGDNVSWQLQLAGGDVGGLAYFSSSVDGAATTGQEVWAFDADFPFAAFPLTTGAADGSAVFSLVPQSTELGVAWAQVADGSDTAASDVLRYDLSLGRFDDIHEATAAFSQASLVFIPAEESSGAGGGAAPPALVYGMGTAGSINPTDGLAHYAQLVGDPNDNNGATGAPITDTGGTLVGNLLYIFHATFD